LPRTPEATGLVWKQYGFNFNNINNSSIIMRIYNNGDGGAGNDFVMDDIEIRFCAPKVNTNITGNDTLVCVGSDLDIVGTYVEDEDKCTFGEDIISRWEFRPVNSAVWNVVDEDYMPILCNDSDPINRTVESTFPISSISEANEGYYRMLVASLESIDNVNCRAVSDSVLVRTVPIIKATDIRIDVCPLQPGQIHLTSFTDSLDYTSINWVKANVAAPDLIDAQKGTINNQIININGTYSYKYSLTSKCGTSNAVAYVHSLKDKLNRKIDTIAICKDLEISTYVNINRILGLEFNAGVWSYPEDDSGAIDNNIISKSFPASSKYTDATVFDARQAWEDATVSGHADYIINYKGDANAKKFVFQYKADDSCIGDVDKKIVIVVTEKMF
jgi:hypothetical protein